MTAHSERRALDKAVRSWRVVLSGQRQSIRRPQVALPAARREEEAPGEAAEPSESA